MPYPNIDLSTLRLIRRERALIVVMVVAKMEGVKGRAYCDFLHIKAQRVAIRLAPSPDSIYSD
jgi:hypothetical protein